MDSTTFNCLSTPATPLVRVRGSCYTRTDGRNGTAARAGTEMTQGFEHNTDGVVPDRAPLASGAMRVALIPLPRLVVVRNTPRNTWDWLWKDTLERVIPLAVAGILYRRFFTDERRLGYAREELGRELLLGAAVGAPLAAITAAFRARVAPGYRLPTPADQAFQTTFYLALNAPAEELFWRGTVQHLTVRLLRLAPPLRRLAVPLGWAFATATYAAYHRLGGWSWRSIAGVAFAGTIFGALYQSGRASGRWSRSRWRTASRPPRF